MVLGWLKKKRAPKQEIILAKPSHQLQLATLQARLDDIIHETEQLAQIKLLEWKIRKVEEQKAWLEHGVHLPQSEHHRNQDEFFHRMEQRIRFEEQQALEAIAKEERAERMRLLDEERRLEFDEQKALEDKRTAEQQEMQLAIAQTIAQALRDDFD